MQFKVRVAENKSVRLRSTSLFANCRKQVTPTESLIWSHNLILSFLSPVCTLWPPHKTPQLSRPFFLVYWPNTFSHLSVQWISHLPIHIWYGCTLYKTHNSNYAHNLFDEMPLPDYSTHCLEITFDQPTYQVPSVDQTDSLGWYTTWFSVPVSCNQILGTDILDWWFRMY